MRKIVHKSKLFKVIIVLCLFIFFIYGYFMLINKSNFNDFLVDSVYEEYAAFLLPDERIISVDNVFSYSPDAAVTTLTSTPVCSV